MLARCVASLPSVAPQRPHPELTHPRTQVAKLVASSSTATLTAFISPYLADRALARSIHEASSIPFVEVFVDAPLEEVEKRDPKGLYKKARAGIIKGELDSLRVVGGEIGRAHV